MYDVRGRIRLRCAACGSVKTPKWREVGVRYGYMMSFFTAGKGAKNTLDHLSKNGGSLHTDSDICNRCWLLFRNNGEGTNISAEAYIAIIEAEPVGERPTAVAGRHVAVQLLGHISRGEVVSLERCTSMLRAELQRAGGVIRGTNAAATGEGVDERFGRSCGRRLRADVLPQRARPTVRQ